MHIFKKDVGNAVRYCGFDGVEYNAIITAYHKGVAVLTYHVRRNNGNMEKTIAYVDRPFHNRISLHS